MLIKQEKKYKMADLQRHIPVLLNEVLQALNVKKGGLYVDATFGFGGYSAGILDKADCKVISIDRDPEVLVRAQEFEQKYQNRFEFKAGTFSNIAQLVGQPVDGVVFDIGVSSMQLDDAKRGFSYLKEARLDMRMSQSGLSAYDVVNSFSEEELADILYQFGEEKKSRQIAKKIVLYRAQKPIETTTELAGIVHEVIYPKKGQTDPATRTFQALRIYVNDELNELQKALEGAKNILKPEGRLVVVDFHSLEDRIVKNFFKANTALKKHISRYKNTEPKEEAPFSKASDIIVASKEEIALNPRAHSAKMRYGIKSKGQ